VDNRSDLTYIDAINQFWTVWENADQRSLTCIGLYFYLCKTWNASGRQISFRRQNNKICGDLSISKPTLETARNKLKQYGLINFFSKGKGDPNITYEIKEVKKFYLKPVEPDPKKPEKEKNFVSDLTSSLPSSLDIKQSIELETSVVIAGEVKKFSYIRDKFLKDEGLHMRWLSQGYHSKGFEFSAGIEHFMQLKNGKDYKDDHDIRTNFFHWIPSFAQEIHKLKVNAERNQEAGRTNGHRQTSGTVAGKTIDFDKA
jgi:hypothetical protein